MNGACECQPPAFLLPLRLQFWKAKHELLICGCAALCCAVLCCDVACRSAACYAVPPVTPHRQKRWYAC